MTLTVGIFDLFTYTIPGSLYLAFLAYLAFRPGWVDPGIVGRIPALVLVIMLVLGSYLLGYLAYPLGAVFNKLVPMRRERRPRQEFLRRVPVARDREYVQADPFLLLSGIQLHDREVGLEVVRLRAGGLMLRNAAPPMLLGCGAGIVEIFVGAHPLLAGLCVALFGVGFFSLVVQGRRMGYWASLKTLELCFWMPDVDEKFQP